MIDLLREYGLPIVMAALLLGVWLTLRTRATPFASPSAVDGAIGAGQPVVLEFFSNT